MLCYIPLSYGFAPHYRPNVFQNRNELTRRNVCGLAVARQTRWFHRHIPGYAEICPGFPPPQAARVTVASGENVLWVAWYNSDVVKVKVQGREIRIGRIQICVRVIIVLVVGINPVTAEWCWPVLVG